MAWTTILKVEAGNSKKYRLTIETKELFGLLKGEVIVEGSSTVWYYFPEGTRVGANGEYRICELITALEMKHGKGIEVMRGERR